MVQKWQNKEEFKKAVIEVADKLELSLGTIYVKSMAGKWGSIKENGKRVYFDSSLLEMDKALGLYVIWHELLHLRVPNHGKLFKTYLGMYVPNYLNLENQLSCKVAIEG